MEHSRARFPSPGHGPERCGPRAPSGPAASGTPPGPTGFPQQQLTLCLARPPPATSAWGRMSRLDRIYWPPAKNKKSLPMVFSNLSGSGMGGGGFLSQVLPHLLCGYVRNRHGLGRSPRSKAKLCVSMQFLHIEFKLVLCALPSPLQCGCILILKFLME